MDKDAPAAFEGWAVDVDEEEAEVRGSDFTGNILFKVY